MRPGSERIVWIDNVKALAIFLVVFGHFVDTPIVKAYVYSFHMHLFFFVSGLLFTVGVGFTPFVKRRFKTLIRPYLIFSLLNYAFFLLRRKFGASPDLSLNPLKKLVGIMTWDSFWFLGCLFVVAVVFHLLSRKIRSKSGFLLLFAVSTGLHWILSTYFTAYVHENLLKCFTAIVFYGLGYLVQDVLQSSALARFDKWRMLFIPIVLAVNLLAFSQAYAEYGLMGINFSENYLYFYLLSISGIFIVTAVAQWVPANAVLSFVGGNTILVYLMDGYPPALIKRFMRFAFQVDNFSDITVGYALLYTCMSICILTPCILAINRYAPYVIGRPYQQATSQ